MFVTEAPVPTIEEINIMGKEDDLDKFKAYTISKEEFEKLWENYQRGYSGNLTFPTE